MTFEALKERLVNGEVCIIETYFDYRNAYNLFESLKKDQDCLVLLHDAYKRFGKDKPVRYGLIIHFSHPKTVTIDPNDPFLEDMKLERERLTKAIEERRVFLKSLTSEFADDTTEGLLLNPAVRENRIQISFNKV